jgi:hypothetical protein
MKTNSKIMKHKSNVVEESYGSKGWIEGSKPVVVKSTQMTSKSTGRTITMAGHISEKPTGREIKERINTGYGKDYRREFGDKPNSFLEDDFE